MVMKNKYFFEYLKSIEQTPNEQPYVIAEVGVNHGGDINKAFELIDLASEAGANAVKFQTYKANLIASKNSPSYWDLKEEPTTSQYQLFKKYDNFEKADYKKLAEHCKKNCIEFLSTPFDDKAIDFLNPLIPFFKVASADITNIPFLKKISLKRKPVILSTGAANIKEIESAVDILSKHGKNKIVIMHCILSYPTKDNDANLGMIADLQNKFPDNLIGYSDHTVPNNDLDALMIAYGLGIRIFEKHFTHDKKLKGNDHYHAIDKYDLIRFRKKIDRYLLLLGNNKKKVIKAEQKSRLHARRSIYAKINLKKGEILTEDKMICKRPGNGLSPTYWDRLLNKQLMNDIKEDNQIKLEDVGIPDN